MEEEIFANENSNDELNLRKNIFNNKRRRSVLKNGKIGDEIKRLILDKYDSGLDMMTISEVLKVNYNSVSSIISCYKKSGNILKKSFRQPKTKKLSNDQENFILDLIQDDVSITLKKMVEKIYLQFSIKVSPSTINRI
jgi:transposase